VNKLEKFIDFLKYLKINHFDDLTQFIHSVVLFYKNNNELILGIGLLFLVSALWLSFRKYKK
jgi:hypothetical protein